MDLLAEKVSHEELSNFIASLPADLRDLAVNYDTQPWRSAKEESRLLDPILERYAQFGLLEQTGRDCVVTALSQTVNSLPKECGITDVVFRIPSFAAVFTTRYRVYVERPEFHTFEIKTDPPAEKPDVHFLKGLIQGLMTTLAVQDAQITDGEGFTRLILPDELLREGVKITYDVYAQQVLKESARVLSDNRDLQTAVEYLNMANRELEKKILVNKRELDMARSIQKGFVPQRVPDWNGLQFWVKFFPFSEVSGDFYDYFYLGSTRFGMVAGDVSGHGVPAALISAIAKFSFSNNRLDSPAQVLESVNMDMLNFVRGEGYLTGFYMIVDNNYGITYSVAAFPNPILFRAKTRHIEQLPGHGTLLGMFPDAGRSYMDYQTYLEPGDKLFIFSDGLIEATNVQGESLGEDKLIDTILETEGMDVQRSSEHIMGMYNRFIRGTDQKDDLTLITAMLSERLSEFDETVMHARRAFHSGDVTHACTLLKKAISIFPRQTAALFLLGKYLALEGKYEEALEYLRQYNGLKPYNADSYRIKGYCYYRLGNLEAASEQFKRALGLRWENPSVLYNQTMVLLKLN
ncbi:MAG TPA: SpoIIE family protein phosphatase [Leptospiraceae bacterium]|nr:SpoIIE family protein phosphatase [Leptospiraceae bacterium]